MRQPNFWRVLRHPAPSEMILEVACINIAWCGGVRLRGDGYVCKAFANARASIPQMQCDAEKRGIRALGRALAGIIGNGPTEVRGYHARLARLKGADKVKVA